MSIQVEFTYPSCDIHRDPSSPQPYSPQSALAEALDRCSTTFWRTLLRPSWLIKWSLGQIVAWYSSRGGAGETMRGGCFDAVRCRHQEALLQCKTIRWRRFRSDSKAERLGNDQRKSTRWCRFEFEVVLSIRERCGVTLVNSRWNLYAGPRGEEVDPE